MRKARTRVGRQLRPRKPQLHRHVDSQRQQSPDRTQAPCKKQERTSLACCALAASKYQPDGAGAAAPPPAAAGGLRRASGGPPSQTARAQPRRTRQQPGVWPSSSRRYPGRTQTPCKKQERTSLACYTRGRSRAAPRPTCAPSQQYGERISACTVFALFRRCRRLALSHAAPTPSRSGCARRPLAWNTNARGCRRAPARTPGNSCGRYAGRPNCPT
jgi:hypothetical protein